MVRNPPAAVLLARAHDPNRKGHDPHPDRALITYPGLLVCFALLAVPEFRANLIAFAGAEVISTMSAPAA